MTYPDIGWTDINGKCGGAKFFSTESQTFENRVVTSYYTIKLSKISTTSVNGLNILENGKTTPNNAGFDVDIGT